ncbi:hypothetical protein BH11PSE5_BH11PSE5_32690 [soil metagenome]
MIIKKIRRQAPARSANSAEFAYLTHLSRYIVRADIADLQELARLSNDGYLRDLARYAVAEGREGAALASGGLNLHGVTLADWQAELAALLHRCPDAAGAIDHWVFSWPDGEKPTVLEAERVIEIFMECQGLKGCKGAWGFHVDTDNPHVHLAAVRIDPGTGARMTAGDGWDIDAAHRAKAVIEAEFAKWIPEPGSRYLVSEGLLIERASSRVVGDAADPATWARRRGKSISNPEQPARDHPAIDAQSLAYEEATGFMSRKRIAIEIAVPIVLRASTLDAAHSALADEGIELRRERSGAAFVINGINVKASIDRRTSHDAITARFSQPLTPSPYKAAQYEPRERWPDNVRRRAYYAARRLHDERLQATAADVRTGLGGQLKHDAVGAALNAAIATAGFPPFELWQPDSQLADPAEAILSAIGFVAVSVSAKIPPAVIQPALEGFRAVKLSSRTVYRHVGQPSGRPAFVDLGHKVLVYAGTDRAAVRASLLLVAARFPASRVAVTGDRAFQKLVLQIAIEEGVALDGTMGRRQAQQIAERSAPLPPPTPTPVHRRIPNTGRVDGERTLARRQSVEDRLLVMLGRVFHHEGWRVDEYRTSSTKGGIPTGLPAQARSIDEMSSVMKTAVDTRHRTAADLARRAAALAAAARSR